MVRVVGGIPIQEVDCGRDSCNLEEWADRPRRSSGLAGGVSATDRAGRRAGRTGGDARGGLVELARGHCRLAVVVRLTRTPDLHVGGGVGPLRLASSGEGIYHRQYEQGYRRIVQMT